MSNIYRDLADKKAKLAVIGLGYVGLPVALAFARKVSVIGFDINEDRIALMRNGMDPSRELGKEAFENADIFFTSSAAMLKEASFFIVAVPTPVDERNIPNLKPLLQAAGTVGGVIGKGDYVVFESTVYPGCTEEECIPLIEAASGLKSGVDFQFGYSPERINPGDKAHTVANIIKIVAGCNEEALETIASMYELVVKAGVHRAPSVKTAEAAKIVENTQRDLNIAFMNELSVIFDKMNINTFDVLEAAGTKWNFLKFQPGLVGGHCTGVDPYYLSYKSGRLGHRAQLVLAARHINDTMAKYVAEKVVKYLIRSDVNVGQAKVLVMGATFKENVSDTRNSKVADIVKALQEFSVKVDIEDPYADNDELKAEYGIELTTSLSKDYEAVIIAVPHREYLLYDDTYFCGITKPAGLIADIKGIYRNKIKNRNYFSL